MNKKFEDLKFDDFTLGYIECAMWSTSDLDSDGNTIDLDRYDIDRIDYDSLVNIINDCKTFQLDNAADLTLAVTQGIDMEHLGHDFWLSRNGHGTGFFDRGLGEIGDRLQEASRKFGEAYLFHTTSDETPIYYENSYSSLK